LVPGDRLVLDRFLLERLGLGYQPVIEVAGRGEFARRGGIVDVFPPGSALPVRIELFGDEVDSLRRFDPTDQRTTERIDSIELLPAPEFDHVAPETLVILDEPGDLAEAAQFLWRQADERRTELVAAGELPRDWPVTYLGPRDWKGRLRRAR